MNWKGKLMVLMLAGAMTGYFLFQDDPRFVRACTTVSTHARGIAQQVQHDFQGVRNVLGNLSKLGSSSH